MAAKHNERCRECKKHVFELLSNIFGEVRENYNLNISNRASGFKKSPYHSYLQEIYVSLQNHRGNKNFIRKKKLPNVDYYVVDHEFIVEFDESQHFTRPRRIALEKYPAELKLGFDKNKWIDLCRKLNRHDNDPIYRDEQRAWYDTLRDFAPSQLNLRPTVRLYAQDYVWCDLDPEDKEDQARFRELLKLKIYNYKSTINQNLIDKKLLLTDRKKGRLYKTSENEHIQIRFNKLGNLITHKITENFDEIPLDYSLEEVGEELLKLNKPTIEEVIKYLVIPEMEVERIFNNMRFKYLESIYRSSLDNPKEYINAKYNRAFQALSGITVYQGNIQIRKDNDNFWKEAGFTDPSKTGICFDNERKELDFILKYIKSVNTDQIPRTYAELIAIKPGFHELYIHSDYFDKKSIPNCNDIRSEIFRCLRNMNDLINSKAKDLDKFPGDINKKNFMSYAPCNVTEGPFVMRKSVDISYYDEIRKIRTKNDIEKLKENFFILDYYHEDINYLEDLANILEKAGRFKGFIN
ncbi:MAG: hypothetical protein QME14_00825 [Methanobacteriaceae archaeon]|nr:hypothetical protein [Methanobacteriaceae archaeon]